MKSIFIKEINTFLNSLIGYIVIVVFLVLAGLLVWVFPNTSVLNYGYAELDSFFSISPYILLFLVPAITMRLFSEERKSGTLETLLTKPISDMGLVMGKFLAAVFLITIAIIPTFMYVFTMSGLSLPTGNIDIAGITGSYLGLIILGGVFASIGLFSSNLTDNQVIAFILAAFLCFFFYEGFHSMALLVQSGYWADQIDQLGISYHYTSLGKGLIDSRNVLYLFSLIVFFLFATKITLEARTW